MIRIVILARSLAVRMGLRALLEQDSEIEVVADDYPAPRHATLPEFDILVIQETPVEAANLATGSLGEQGDSNLEFSLLVISDTFVGVPALQALPLRAWGVLPEDASPEELVAAVRALHEGLVAAPAEALEALLQAHVLPGVSQAANGDAGDLLTDRESEVLHLLAQGMANKQIAQALKISPHTVKFHVSSIYTKLGATNRAEAVRLGYQNGLVSL